MATILLVSEHSTEIQRFSTILDQLWCCPCCCCCCCCVHKLQVSIPLKLCECFEFADTVLGALLFYYLYKHTHHQNEDMDHKGHSLPNAAAAPKVFVRTRDSSLSLSPCLTLPLEYWCQWISHDVLHPVDDDDILEYLLWSQNNIQRKAVANSRALEKFVTFALGKYVPTTVSHVACSFLSIFLLLWALTYINLWMR